MVPLGEFRAAFRAVKFRIEVFEITVLVPRGNARAAKRSRGAILARAIARHGPDPNFLVGPFDRFFPGSARQSFFFRNVLDGFPPCPAAQRTIFLRHESSIGAEPEMRKPSRPVESAG